jgi:hypothetical protein
MVFNRFSKIAPRLLSANAECSATSVLQRSADRAQTLRAVAGMPELPTRATDVALSARDEAPVSTLGSRRSEAVVRRHRLDRASQP